jgi:hypothetical protein
MHFNTLDIFEQAQRSICNQEILRIHIFIPSGANVHGKTLLDSSCRKSFPIPVTLKVTKI